MKHTGFISHLIGRHQNGEQGADASISTLPKIQPRLNTRFENPLSNSTTMRSTAITEDTEQLLRKGSSVFDTSFHDREVVARRRNSESNLHFNQQSTGVTETKNEMGKTLTAGKFDSPLIDQSVHQKNKYKYNSDKIDNRMLQTSEYRNEKITERNSDTSRREFKESFELHQRINEILARLPVESKKQSQLPLINQLDINIQPQLQSPGDLVQNTSIMRYKNKKVPHESDVYEGQQRVSEATPHHPIEPLQKSAMANIINKPGQENKSNAQPGLFEIPSWLSQLQQELRARVNDRAPNNASEPVINVTIGRVEVRAVQGEQIKNNRAKPKPKTVLGLDEYLKQGRGGSAT